MPMPMDFDVAIVGGAFSGASLALLLRREQPGLSVVIVERSEKFDRKVGEATTEVSGDFLHKRLAMTRYLANHHLPKQGLRMWFAESPQTPFDECVEVGPNFQVRMPSFQIDRAELDEHLLAEAEAAGAVLLRPAKVSEVEVSAEGGMLKGTRGEEAFRLRARWVVDASGRAALLARKFGMLRSLEEHPTNAVWARFRGVEDWDGHALRSRFSDYAKSGIASRAASTNHLMGYGWWCWIIPLKGGDFSAGLVYDRRLFALPKEGHPGARLKAHLLSHPVGREIFQNAEPIENDVRAYSGLPYASEKLAGPGWQIVGDAAGFLDPLYSAGLDYCSWTVRCALGRIAAEAKGESVDLEKVNRHFRESYAMWFESLYRDKYVYLGDAELMAAAFWMDIALFYMGPVREVTTAREADMECFPFNGPVDRLAGRFMRFYNGRLALLARKRLAAGCYGRRNRGWRQLGGGFTPDAGSLRLFALGLRHWLRAEWHGLFLRPRRGWETAAANIDETSSQPVTAI